ncbi:hypothetical protein CU098_005218 [Rhizopus stolonifer]|uniref:Uncharacterized protein n=1 Tax=Rhizopus stolonifer TaxID=4846 RepID=A0A367KCW9_RHIST|nr:hypothetical protein CU098_005218 [Rhizopus stolonifer]
MRSIGPLKILNRLSDLFHYTEPKRKKATDCNDKSSSEPLDKQLFSTTAPQKTTNMRKRLRQSVRSIIVTKRSSLPGWFYSSHKKNSGTLQSAAMSPLDFNNRDSMESSCIHLSSPYILHRLGWKKREPKEEHFDDEKVEIVISNSISSFLSFSTDGFQHFRFSSTLLPNQSSSSYRQNKGCSSIYTTFTSVNDTDSLKTMPSEQYRQESWASSQQSKEIDDRLTLANLVDAFLSDAISIADKELLQEQSNQEQHRKPCVHTVKP